MVYCFLILTSINRQETLVSAHVKSFSRLSISEKKKIISNYLKEFEFEFDAIKLLAKLELIGEKSFIFGEFIPGLVAWILEHIQLEYFHEILAEGHPGRVGGIAVSAHSSGNSLKTGGYHYVQYCNCWICTTYRATLNEECGWLVDNGTREIKTIPISVLYRSKIITGIHSYCPICGIVIAGGWFKILVHLTYNHLNSMFV